MSNSIHKFVQGGDYFVIDPASGAVHITDKLAYDMLDEIKPPLSAVSDAYFGDDGDCYAQIYELYKSGLIFSEDNCAQYAALDAAPPIKAICLHVSHDCNLRCEYCFAKAGGYGSQKQVMSVQTAIKAIDFLIENSGERTELEADFFGGEPLMAWDAVVGAVDYARSKERKIGKRFRFTVTTNGLLLDDEKIDYINREMTNCVLSLDGRKDVNDRVRPTANGKGSYDLIIPGFKKLVERRNKPGFTDYYVRGTFTAYNLDFADDIIEMSRLGFRNVSIEPVTAEPKLPYAIKAEHIPRVLEEYDRLYTMVKTKEIDVNFFHYNVDLSGGPCVIRRLRGCGCGNEYVAVTPEGRVYPCHRFVGNGEWDMGSIEGGSLDAGIKETFSKTHIYSKSSCAECWARFYCSGGCNATSYYCYGDVRESDPGSAECLMMKKRLECAIALSATG